MRLAFRERPWDLVVVLAFGVALLPSIALTGAVRVALGLAFVLFLPGYALVAALFPKDGEIDWIERIALSFGLSIAVVPLLGLLLNYTPWGIRLEPIVGTVFLFTLGMCGLAYRRRMEVPPEKRLALSIDLAPPKWKEYTLVDKALTIALVASIVLAAGTLAYVVATPRPGDRFTEFYVLDANGTVEDYPSRLNVSENATVILGVVDHEFTAVSYTVEARLVTVQLRYNATTGQNDTVEIANATLATIPMGLEDGKSWESPYTFAIAAPGTYKLRFLLYEGAPQPTPYRGLHLWITVT